MSEVNLLRLCWDESFVIGTVRGKCEAPDCIRSHDGCKMRQAVRSGAITTKESIDCMKTMKQKSCGVDIVPVLTSGDSEVINQCIFPSRRKKRPIVD